MSYQIRVAPSAADELTEYLTESIGSACVRFIFGPLANDPKSVGTPLLAPFAGHWSAERGEYRIRYHLDDAARRLDVLDITHRRDPSTRALLR